MLTASQVEDLLEAYRKSDMIDIPEDVRVTLMDKREFALVFKLRTDKSWTDKRLPGVTIPLLILLRVNLPWAPYYSTKSEVATMVYLRSRGVPAPKVYFFESSAKNPLGVEFTLQELIQPSTSLDSALSNSSPAVAKSLVLEAVKLQDAIWNAGDFAQSGSLYCNWETKDYFVGPMIDPEFFAPLLETEYGPFNSW